MNRHHHFLTTLFGALVMTLVAAPVSTNALAQDDAALKAMITQKAAIKIGRSKAQNCTRCHGRDGVHRLAERSGWTGTDGAFAVEQLLAFRDGRRKHDIMSAVSAGLSDSDIAAIGLWLDSLAIGR